MTIRTDWNSASKAKKAGIIALMVGGIGIPTLTHFWNKYRAGPELEARVSQTEQPKLGKQQYDYEKKALTYKVPANQDDALPIEREMPFQDEEAIGRYNDFAREYTKLHKPEIGDRKLTPNELYQLWKKMDDPKEMGHPDVVTFKEADNALNKLKTEGRTAFKIDFDAPDIRDVDRAYDKASQSAQNYWNAASRFTADQAKYQKARATWNYRRQHR